MIEDQKVLKCNFCCRIISILKEDPKKPEGTLDEDFNICDYLSFRFDGGVFIRVDLIKADFTICYSCVRNFELFLEGNKPSPRNES